LKLIILISHKCCHVINLRSIRILKMLGKSVFHGEGIKDYKFGKYKNTI